MPRPWHTPSSTTTGAAYYGIPPPVAQMLDWLIRHDPAFAAHTINEVIGEAELRFCMPRDVVQNSICMALSLDSQLDAQTIERFLDKVLPPSSGGEARRSPSTPADIRSSGPGADRLLSGDVATPLMTTQGTVKTYVKHILRNWARLTGLRRAVTLHPDAAPGLTRPESAGAAGRT